MPRGLTVSQKDDPFLRQQSVEQENDGVGKGAGGVKLRVEGRGERDWDRWCERLDELDDRVLSKAVETVGTQISSADETVLRIPDSVLTSPTSSGKIESGTRMGILNPLYSATVSK